MFNRDQLLAHGCIDARAAALTIVGAALEAVDPAKRLLDDVHVSSGRLHVNGDVYDLARYHRIYVVGAGKATYAMAAGLESVLGLRLTDGFIAVKSGQASSLALKYGFLRKVRVLECGHPLPDLNSLAAGQEVMRIARAATRNDLVFCLMTGGISSLCVAPVDGLLFEDKLRLYDALVHSGADTTEMMTVRSHLSKIKGGKLAQMIAPATTVGLCVSDEKEDGLEWCASWTVSDKSSADDAIGILQRYDVWHELPDRLRQLLVRHERGPSTNPLGVRVQNHMLVRTRDLWPPAAQAATLLGLAPTLLTTVLSGESRHAGTVLGGVVSEISRSGSPVPAPCAVVALGETTVRVEDSRTGGGGPNQELGIAAALAMGGGGCSVALCAIDTDGTDGPTGVAGALVDGLTVARAHAVGINLTEALHSHDASAALTAIGDAVIMGHTGTNVNDIIVSVVYPPRQFNRTARHLVRPLNGVVPVTCQPSTTSREGLSG